MIMTNKRCIVKEREREEGRKRVGEREKKRRVNERRKQIDKEAEEEEKYHFMRKHP